MTDNLVVRRPPVVIFDPRSHIHDPGRGHPEAPQRIAAALDGVKRSGLWEESESRQAPMAAIHAVHDPAYVRSIEELSRRGGGVVIGDTVASSGTFEASIHSCGAVLQGVEIAAAGRPVICLSRPPGHHAGRDAAMGFCFFNNAAVAARFAQSSGVASRVAIFDFDVHHGNGTQDIFSDDPSILYISVHQWPWYPGTGALEETGGSGNIVNIPMPAYAGDREHIAVTSSIVIPVIRAFEPQMLIVSAGFDAHEDDPLSLQSMTDQGFAEMAGMISGVSLQVCGIPPVVVLEGGYSLTALRDCLGSVAEALVPGPRLSQVQTSAMPAHPSLNKVVRFHVSRWGR